MIQADALTTAIRILARVIGERAEQLRANDCDPQRLVDALTDMAYQLQACIDPDELEKLS